MKYDAVIFDLDGVICHTDKYHYQAWQAVAQRLGIPFDEKTNNRLRGISRAESFEIILEAYDGVLTQKQKKRYIKQKNDIYVSLLRSMKPDDVSAEVKDTIEKIKQKGIPIAIGSSSKNARTILKKTNLYGLFDAVSDGNDISNSKPDPEVFLKAARKMGIKPKRCLVVEDAESGVQAALAAGMDCAAIGDAAKHGTATYNLKSILELIDLLQ